MTIYGFDATPRELANAIKPDRKFQRELFDARLDMRAIFNHMMRRAKKKESDESE